MKHVLNDRSTYCGECRYYANRCPIDTHVGMIIDYELFEDGQLLYGIEKYYCSAWRPREDRDGQEGKERG